MILVDPVEYGEFFLWSGTLLKLQVALGDGSWWARDVRIYPVMGSLCPQLCLNDAHLASLLKSTLTSSHGLSCGNIRKNSLNAPELFGMPIAVGVRDAIFMVGPVTNQVGAEA